MQLSSPLLFIVFFMSIIIQAHAEELIKGDSTSLWRQTHLTQNEQDWLAKLPVIRHGT